MRTLYSPPPDRGARSRHGFGTVGWIGVAILGLFAAVALAGAWIAPYGGMELAAPTLEAPSLHHLLGTNQIGQDLLSQLLIGARVSLLVALLAGSGSVLIGATVGIVAGFAGRWIDMVLMRLTDVFLAIPKTPLLILVAAYAGRSLTTLSLVIASLFWAGTARIMRAQVRTLRHRSHIRASIGFGAVSGHVLRRHVAPELAPLLAASFVAAAGRAVLLQAGLAFVGISDPSRLSWGTIMAGAFNAGGIFYTRVWMWWLLPPVLATVLVLVGMTFLGVGLEQRFNPRLVRRPGAVPLRSV